MIPLSVIPAEAGIHGIRLTDRREAPDPRLRGDDGEGAGTTRAGEDGYCVFAPAWNHCPTTARSASVIPVALFSGMSFITTACW